jgi:5-methylcytosine-specific restriction endonuclease McrA
MVSTDAFAGALGSGACRFGWLRGNGDRRSELLAFEYIRDRLPRLGRDHRSCRAAHVSQALVLNASYEPLCVVTSRRALMLAMEAKAEVLSVTDRMYHSARNSWEEPSVVRLTYFVRVPYQARVALNRRAIFARDGHRCQYCGAPAENIDHVVPKSKGGRHAWDNVVAACRRCNTRKRDHLLEESGMKLRRLPAAPRERTWVLLATGSVRPDWEPYLPGMQMTTSSVGPSSLSA